MRRQKSLMIGVHLANGVVWGLVYRTRLKPDLPIFLRAFLPGPALLDAPAPTPLLRSPVPTTSAPALRFAPAAVCADAPIASEPPRSPSASATVPRPPPPPLSCERDSPPAVAAPLRWRCEIGTSPELDMIGDHSRTRGGVHANTTTTRARARSCARRVWRARKRRPSLPTSSQHLHGPSSRVARTEQNQLQLFPD